MDRAAVCHAGDRGSIPTRACGFFAIILRGGHSLETARPVSSPQQAVHPTLLRLFGSGRKIQEVP